MSDLSKCTLFKVIRRFTSTVQLCSKRPVIMLRLGIWIVIAALVVVSASPVAWWQGIIAAFLVYFITGGWKFIYIAARTAPRDITAGLRYLRLRFFVYNCLRKNSTLPSVFEELLRKHPNKACFIFEEKVWTYKDVDEYSSRVANFFSKAGFKRGDVIAIFMESCPEYVSTWLGLSKIGICSALINHNLKQQTLIHSITTAEAKALIFGKELWEAVKEVKGPLNHDFQYYCVGSFDTSAISAKPLDSLLQECSLDYPELKISSTDNLVYIYTSGTTGLPKPAIIHHSRYIFTAAGVHIMLSFNGNDVLYTSLPLYHTSGGVLGVGQALIFGNTVAIRRKFSASKFWDDCVKYNCTVTQYIGEICRYLLSQPVRSIEQQHKVHKIFGNGLRPQIWELFKTRFRIKLIGELYGATEGNANIINIDNQPSAIGFVSRIAPCVYPVTLIKVDEATGEPIRDANGMCIKCNPGEPGEFVGKIVKDDPEREFLGYVSKTATERKIIRNVFKKNDYGFLSGDVLVMDELGYIYFKDRTGDTFRWKGENVSTSEIEAVISNIIGLKDCVVYGVEISGYEGRAGMAAILDVDESLNLETLAAGIQKALPSYARPVFLRIVTKIDMTGTYKLRKVEIQKKGFELGMNKVEKVYYLDALSGSYKLLTHEIYEQINKGTIRL